jgi:hypothetical protein
MYRAKNWIASQVHATRGTLKARSPWIEDSAAQPTVASPVLAT